MLKRKLVLASRGISNPAPTTFLEPEADAEEAVPVPVTVMDSVPVTLPKVTKGMKDSLTGNLNTPLTNNEVRF